MRAHAAWAEARAANDVKAYAALLKRVMAMQPAISQAIGGVNPYGPMVTKFEPGMTDAQVQAALVPLMERAADAGPPRMAFLSHSFPVPPQNAFEMKMAARMGYDPASVRSIFTPDLVNLYAVTGARFGMHERQSRLWENRVGRARGVWDLHFGELRDVSADAFWRSANAVRPDCIRVEADEPTQDMHIILRPEIEAAPMAGKMEVDARPTVRAEKMKDYPGVTVPDDTRGVLRDVHWSHGCLGSFPTCTLGNIMALQFFRKAQSEPGIAKGLQTGDDAP